MPNPPGRYTDPREKLLRVVDDAQMNPMVSMDWDLWCRSHMEFLREQWPKGSGLAMIGLFEAAAADSRIMDYCQGEAENLTAALKHFSPVCCLLGDEVMHGIAARVKEKAGV